MLDITYSDGCKQQLTFEIARYLAVARNFVEIDAEKH
jgi:hypothetical protein